MGIIIGRDTSGARGEKQPEDCHGKRIQVIPAVDRQSEACLFIVNIPLLPCNHHP